MEEGVQCQSEILLRLGGHVTWEHHTNTGGEGSLAVTMSQHPRCCGQALLPVSAVISWGQKV